MKKLLNNEHRLKIWEVALLIAMALVSLCCGGLGGATCARASAW